MIIDRKNIRFLSMLGQRGTFAMAMMELAESIDHMAVFTADLGSLSGLDRFKETFPDKFYNVGIAEQNMIGIAAGMAKLGTLAYATTYANFITMRSFEQIRINLGYMQFPVKIVGSGAGIIMSMSGNSHYGLEDMAIMRAIPNMTVVSPADSVETFKVMQASAVYDKPMYIRLTGGLNCPVVYKADYDFTIGKAVYLKEGADVAIIAVGTLVSEALKAAQLLEEQSISVAVINMHTIKPLDIEALEHVFSEAKLIVTVEEHSKIGGLGSTVAEYKATKNNAPPQLFIGLPDTFGKAGAYEYLLDKYGLTAAKICEQIIERLRELPK